MDFDSKVKPNDIKYLLSNSNVLKKAGKYKKQIRHINKQENKHPIRKAALTASCAVAAVLLISTAVWLKTEETLIADNNSTYKIQSGSQEISTIALERIKNRLTVAAEVNKPSATDIEAVYEAPVQAVQNEVTNEILKLRENFSQDILPETQSEEVKIVQQRLMDLGYMEEDDPTDYYNTVMQQAVESFQNQHEMESNGIATYETIQTMFTEDAQSFRLTLNHKGEDVKQIQMRLNVMGYNVKSNGNYDQKTQSAVTEFQIQNELEQTGEVDSELRELIYSSNAITANGEEIGFEINPESGELNVDALIYIAKKQLGKKYVRGAKGAGSFDCSGFVYYCLNASGYKISYLTSAAWRSSKYEKIKKIEDLQPGDICVFVGHVGIYIGNGEMIDASSSAGKVRIAKDIFNSNYCRNNWAGGRRLIK